MNKLEISNYRPKDTHSTCIYCGDTLSVGKFCRPCTSYIYKLGLSTKDIDNCLEALDKRDCNRESLICLHCGKPARRKSFCNTDYIYLKRKKADFSDKEICLKILQERDEWRDEVKNRKKCE